MTLTVMATGIRDWMEPAVVSQYIQRMAKHRPLILHGGAQIGPDRMIEAACETYHIDFEAVPADWPTHGKAAADIRWQEMIERSDCALIFHDRVDLQGKHLVARLKKNKLPSWIVYSRATASVLGYNRERLNFRPSLSDALGG